MDIKNDVIIAGGGLASYPHHKVCGEYISNEVLRYLQSLGIDPTSLKPTQINQFQFSTSTGNIISATLPLGGFGISRYTFDDFLMRKARENGAEIIHDTVLNLNFIDGKFEIKTAANGDFIAPIVLGAFGKRSTIDNKLHRGFMKQPSPWLAVKAHYKGDFNENTVALHHFKGGYCGISKVEDNKINICYLTDYASFKKHRNLEDFQEQVLFENKNLKSIFENCHIDFETPMSIGQISFQKKESVNAHVLMIGDAAGLIHPLCGNGMSMAIHSAKLCAEQVLPFFEDKGFSRKKMEQCYSRQWKYHFTTRLLMGRFLSAILQRETLAEFMTSGLAKYPFILPQLIKRTHGYDF
jgi:flavin-dependent dehydrogenase